MDKLQRVIAQLKEGTEFCGHCGKVVTDGPDCIHLTSGSIGAMISPNARSSGVQTKGPEGYIREETMRIGSEMLMDIPHLESLCMFDKPSKYGADAALNFCINYMMHGGEAAETKMIFNLGHQW